MNVSRVTALIDDTGRRVAAHKEYQAVHRVAQTHLLPSPPVPNCKRPAQKLILMSILIVAHHILCPTHFHLATPMAHEGVCLVSRAREGG